MKYNLAVVGATGLVGRKILQVLSARNIPINNLYLFASEKSEGYTLPYNGLEIPVHALKTTSVPRVQYAIFSAGAEVSGAFAPVFRDMGAVVVDNSSRWRKDENVPLIVPEVNSNKMKKHNGIIANPNCSTIQAVVALSPVWREFGLKRVVYTTFQSVSGAGRRGFVDLINGSHGILPKVFGRKIFANVIPQIGDFDRDGNTTEENKMIYETKKILGDDKISISATCTRVPVFFCHGESVCFTTRQKCTLGDVKAALQGAPGVIFKESHEQYVTQTEAEESDEVFVSRLRSDADLKNTFSMWLTADNVRKGAATNAVQIVEELIKAEKNIL